MGGFGHISMKFGEERESRLKSFSKCISEDADVVL